MTNKIQTLLATGVFLWYLLIRWIYFPAIDTGIDFITWTWHNIFAVYTACYALITILIYNYDSNINNNNYYNLSTLILFLYHLYAFVNCFIQYHNIDNLIVFTQYIILDTSFLIYFITRLFSFRFNFFLQ